MTALILCYTPYHQYQLSALTSSQQKDYIICALELSNEHSGIGSVDAQLPVEHRAQACSGFSIVHDLLYEVDVGKAMVLLRMHI